jgi:hypothetical protein
VFLNFHKLYRRHPGVRNAAQTLQNAAPQTPQLPLPDPPSSQQRLLPEEVQGGGLLARASRKGTTAGEELKAMTPRARMSAAAEMVMYS